MWKFKILVLPLKRKEESEVLRDAENRELSTEAYEDEKVFIKWQHKYKLQAGTGLPCYLFVFLFKGLPCYNSSDFCCYYQKLTLISIRDTNK